MRKDLSITELELIQTIIRNCRDSLKLLTVEGTCSGNEAENIIVEDYPTISLKQMYYTLNNLSCMITDEIARQEDDVNQAMTALEKLEVMGYNELDAIARALTEEDAK